MFTYLSAWKSGVHQFDAAVRRIEPAAEAVGVQLPEQSQWLELLRLKLLPQLADEPWLVVSVVGGTNIGKSAIFNLMAGEQASAVSPMAAGTRHPVCLVPPGFDDQRLLDSLFDSFQLHRWGAVDDPLSHDQHNLMFWRVGKQVPPRLLLIDAPDIDSDVRINWTRARALRQVSDVLLAVLTQQKYNDAAVKQFFREAAQADKPTVVLINQCDMEADNEYWPHWLATFCEETGIRPESVFVLPWDRQAAIEARLPIYDVGPDATQPPTPCEPLAEQLSHLQFEQIKIRTLRGALRQVVDPSSGADTYLQEIRAKSSRFAEAGAAMSASEMVRVQWPTLPTRLLVDEIRNWWDADRPPWSKRIHGFYRTVGQGLSWPVRQAMRQFGSGDDAESNSAARFRQAEREAILIAVEKLFDELERLADVGNETLRPRLQRLLGGSSRLDILERIRKEHDALAPVDDDYRDYLRRELDQWREESPGSFRFLRALDHAGAVARPAITVTLAVGGFMLAGDILGQATAHVVSHAVTEAAIAGGITGSGEVAVSTAGEGIRQAAARLFLRLQSQYAERRAQWLADWLETELLGGLLGELHNGASICQTSEFRELEESLESLKGLFDQSYTAD